MRGAGFEPARPFGQEGLSLPRLPIPSPAHSNLATRRGIEPLSSRRQRVVIPLYEQARYLAEPTGVEPAPPSVTGKCTTSYATAPRFGAGWGIRTLRQPLKVAKNRQSTHASFVEKAGLPVFPNPALFGTHCKIRTCIFFVRSEGLYPVKLSGHCLKRFITLKLYF